jgi:REP element-mobilizing transposase RayT
VASQIEPLTTQQSGEPRPGDTLMITRRTLRRHHLFRPDSAIRELYLYTLALCARQFGILVHAVTLMSTHEHLIVTDPQGRYPDFLRRLHRLVSLGTKVLRKWEGPTWDHEPSSVVRLLTEQAVVEKLGACAGCTASPSTRSSTPHFDTSSVLHLRRPRHQYVLSAHV